MHNLALFELHGFSYTNYQLSDTDKYWWRSLIGFLPLGFPEMTLEKFIEAFFDIFMPSSLRDQIRDVFGHLVQSSMTVTEYEAKFHFFSRYSYTSITIKFEKIKKFIKRLYISLQLSSTQMVVYAELF